MRYPPDPNSRHFESVPSAHFGAFALRPPILPPMFTGLVQAVGVVRQAKRRADHLALTIDTDRWTYAKQARPGDSVSVAGVCLTITNRPTSRDPRFCFDVVAETLDKLGSANFARATRSTSSTPPRPPRSSAATSSKATSMASAASPA